MGKYKEGRRIKSRNPMDVVATFIMPTRNGAANHFSDTIDLEACDKYITQKRAEGLKGFGMMHIIMAAYVRTCSQKPGINRFLRGQRVYARNNVEICIVIKKELKLDGEETVIKLISSPTDTADIVYEKLSKLIEENKGIKDKSSVDYLSLVLSKFPRIFLKFAVWLLRCADYFGLLPRSLTLVSPFHGSMFLTNLGSLGIPPVFHHLYDFGNLPVFISMGATHKKLAKDKEREGAVVEKRYMDYTVVCDERICDGHYYASAFKSMKSIFKHPEILDNPPEKVVDDIA